MSLVQIRSFAHYQLGLTLWIDLTLTSLSLSFLKDYDIMCGREGGVEDIYLGCLD